MSIADNNPLGQDVREHALDVWHRLGRLADGFQHYHSIKIDQSDAGMSPRLMNEKASKRN